jgi:replicative DNA helicase
MRDDYPEIRSLEAERAVVGAILIDRNALAVVLDTLAPSDFYADAHGRILEACIALQDRGQPPDLVLLANELRGRGALEKVGGASYLCRLSDETASAVNVLHYCRIVKEKALVRSVIEAAQRIIDKAHNLNGDGADTLNAFAQKEILSVSASASGSGGADLREILKRSHADMEERYHTGNALPGLSTGISGLDTLTGGLRDGRLYILAGRPGSGKTAFTLNVSRKVVGNVFPVDFFSLEMPSMDLSQRLVSSETGIDGHNITRGYLSPDQWKSVTRTTDALAKLPIWIDDTGGLPIDRLMARARRRKIEKGIRLIVVDYLQLVRPSQKWGTREKEVAEVSRSLKVLAKELSVPVLACAQLNRAMETRTTRTPVLSDLRESGAIEQDADVIMFLREAEDDGSTELTIAKNRQGKTGRIALIFDKARTRFLEPQHDGGRT